MKHTEILEAVKYILNKNTAGDGVQYDVNTMYPDYVGYTLTDIGTGEEYRQSIHVCNGMLAWDWKEDFQRLRKRWLQSIGR
jgi:hypothetical protein